jgi:hypothetical protein
MNNEKNSIPIDDNEREWLINIFSITATLLSVLILGNLFAQIMASFIKNPDIDFQEYIVSDFRPEPMEKSLYYFILLSLPFLIVIFHNIFRKKVKYEKLNYREIYAVFACTIISIVLFAYSSKSNYGLPDYFYVRNLFFFNHLFVYLFIYLLILICVLYLLHKNIDIPKRMDILITVLSIIIIVFLILFIFLWYWKGANLIPNQHLEAVIYSIAQVFNGKGILIDFTNQYGLYPIFISPILRITGFSIVSITGIMATLISLSYFCIYIFIKNVIKTKLIVFIGFVSFCFLYLILRLDGFYSIDPYFQYSTLRFLFPCILLGLGTYYFKKPSKKLYYILVCIVSVGILWNFDSGIVVYMTFLLTLIYNEVLEYDFKINIVENIKIITKRSVKHILIFAFVLMVFICLFFVYSFIKYKEFPLFSDFIKFQKIFSDLGFAALPMPKYHPWIIYTILHVVGLSIAFSGIFTKINKYLCTVIFLVSIMGCGLFSYYQGRSHDLTYYHIRLTAILLGIIFFEMLFHRIKYSFTQKRVIIGEIILFSSLLFYYFSPICSLFEKGLFRQFVADGIENISGIKDQKISIYDEYVKFIKYYTIPGENTIILSDLQGALYGYTGTSNPVKMPGLIETLRVADYDNLIKYITEHKYTKLFIQRSYLARTELAASVYLNYCIVDSIDGLVYFKHTETTDALFQGGSYCDGFYADGWINGDATIFFSNKTSNLFSFFGFYPRNFPADNRFTVTVNNRETTTVDLIPGNSFNVELNFESNHNIARIGLKTERVLIPKKEGWNEDTRELAMRISSWELSNTGTDTIFTGNN